MRLMTLSAIQVLICAMMPDSTRSTALRTASGVAHAAGTNLTDQLVPIVGPPACSTPLPSRTGIAGGRPRGTSTRRVAGVTLARTVKAAGLPASRHRTRGAA
jgi:hypothetical protein